MVEKEVLIAYFDVVLQHLLRGNEGNQKTCHDWCSPGQDLSLWHSRYEEVMCIQLACHIESWLILKC